MDNKEMLEQIAKLTAENEALKSRAEGTKDRALSFKVSQKGACSVYGVGRFPVTLYKQQWLKLFTNIEAIKAFIQANETTLSEKVKPANVTPIKAA